MFVSIDTLLFTCDRMSIALAMVFRDGRVEAELLSESRERERERVEEEGPSDQRTEGLHPSRTWLEGSERQKKIKQKARLWEPGKKA